MRVQRRSKGKGARYSREVPDPHLVPIVRARLHDGNLVPADMKGCAIPAVCRLVFDDPVPAVRLETGNVIPGTAPVLDRGSLHFVSMIIAAKGTKVVKASPEALPFAGFHSFGNDNVNVARLGRRQSVEHH